MSKRWLMLIVLLLPAWSMPALATSATVEIVAGYAEVSVALTLPPARLAPHGMALPDADWSDLAAPGAPRLPRRTFWLAVPAGTTARLAAAASSPGAMLHVRPLAQPGWQLADTDPATRPLATPAVREDAALFGRAYPAQPVELGAPVFLRDQQLVPLLVTAGRWEPAQQAIQPFQTVTARVEFVASSDHPQAARPDPLGQAMLESLVVNPAALARPDLPAPAAPLPPAAITLLRLTIPAPGLYRLPLSQLPAAWSDLAAVHLYQGAQEIPRQRDAFALWFYVDTPDPTWSASGGVIVRYEPGTPAMQPAQRTAQSMQGSPQPFWTATQHIEQQTIYISADPRGEHEDHWWGWLWLRTATSADPINIGLQLPAQAALDQPATLRVRLHGGAQGVQHRVAVLLNGTPVGQADWTGRNLLEASFPVTPNLLLLTNTVTLQPLVADAAPAERGYVDWVALDYAQPFVAQANQLAFTGETGRYAVTNLATPAIVWDVTTPTQPVVLSNLNQSAGTLSWADEPGRRYWVQSVSTVPVPAMTVVVEPDLRAESNRADYLALTYNPPGTAAWSSALQPLLDRRDQQGLVSLLVDVQWIYDQFGTGQVDPAAIRAFIAHAYSRWAAPAPSYVLLVGDGTSDPRHYSSFTTQENYLPPYLSYVDPWLGETAADNRYVTVAGADDVPDLLIGRMPAHSASDVSLMVAKTLAYESTDPNAAWLHRLLLVGDQPDEAGDFHALTTSLAATISAPFTSTVQLYSTGQNVPAFRTALVNNINAGALLVNYTGHGGIDVWGKVTLYNATDIAALNNADRLTIMLPMTCYTGYFQDPTYTALAEQELLHSGGGAVASWSPTGLGIATGHDLLSRGLLDSVLRRGYRRLGAATLAGRLLLASDGGPAQDLLNTYTLFGDPALRLPLAARAPVAANDSYSIGYQHAQSLPVLENDADPYATPLVLQSATGAAHGQLALGGMQGLVTYTPDAGYYGPDLFTYSVLNPTNGHTATAQVQLSVERPDGLVLLPFVMR